MRENYGKNTVGLNEFTDFKQFGLEHPDFTKTIVATNWANHPGDGITLQADLSHHGCDTHQRGRHAPGGVVSLPP